MPHVHQARTWISDTWILEWRFAPWVYTGLAFIFILSKYSHRHECKFLHCQFLVFEIYINSWGNFFKTFQPSILGMSHLFHKIILVAVVGSRTSICLNQLPESTWLFRKQWKMVSGRKNTSLQILIQSTMESVGRLRCFKFVGKVSKRYIKKSRNDGRHSQNYSVW